MAFIYKLTNKVSNKSYIGYTDQEHGVRLNQHFLSAFNIENENFVNKILYKAIRKHGKESFEYSVIYEHEDKSLVLDIESHYIKEYNTFIGNENSHGYNADTGGRMPTKTQEQKDAHSAKIKGVPKPEGFGERVSKRVSGSDNPMFGKLGELHPGFGIPLSDDHKKSVSDGVKAYYETHPGIQTGIPHTEAAKKKMADKNTKRYELMNEDGTTFWIENIEQYCSEVLGLTKIYFSSKSKKLEFIKGVRIVRSIHKNGTEYVYGVSVRSLPAGYKHPSSTESKKNSIRKALAKYCVIQKKDGITVLVKNLSQACKHYKISDGNLANYGKSKGFVLVDKNVDPTKYSHLLLKDYS